jgi:hypothetical protein
MGKIALIPEVGNKPITEYIEESQQGEPKHIDGNPAKPETHPQRKR